MTTARTPATRAAAAVVVWGLCLVVGIVVAVRTRYVADLSAFLPAAPSAEQAVLLEQLKSGAASRLLLVGIAGGDADRRADASKQLADRLRASGLFASVDNGDTAAWASGGRFVFEHRYALSPAVDAERFGVAGLRNAIDETVGLLGTPAGSLIKPILFRDPTGETVRIAEAMTPASGPRSEHGVWVSRDAPRAVLVATTRAGGDDLDGQAAALAAIRAAFAPLAAPGVALEISGAGKFGVESRERIKAEAERLAIFGAGAIVVLLVVTFGSLRALAIAMLPVGTAVVAGIAAVSLAFGQVHGMTLGFGTTLIGEAVDYAIYFLIQVHRGRASTGGGDAAPAPVARWLRDGWPVIRLGLVTSLIGFAALVFSGFPGLAQLGVFSIAGLVAAAATTRFVFPRLAPNGAAGRGLRPRLGRFMERAAAVLPRARWAVVLLAVAAAGWLVARPSPWHGELAQLSPISASDLGLDAALRRDVGAPDAGALVAVAAPGEAAALEAAERIGRALDPLIADGVIAGYDSPAKWLPSPATQARRRAALPDATTLAQRLAEATDGGALPAARLAPFIAEVEAARRAPTFDRAALDGTPLAVAVDALLVRGDDQRPWRALVNLQGGGQPIDTPRVQAALSAIDGARVVAVKAELDAVYARFLREAEWQAALGAAAVLLLLGATLRRLDRLVAVVAPIAAATLVVLAIAAARNDALGVLHLVGLLLTVAIGSNYALFFEELRFRQRPAGATDDPDDAVDAAGADGADAETLASLLVANLTTVASFALLATSAIPVLRAVGEVVAPGAALALVFSAAWLGGRTRHGKIAHPRGTEPTPDDAPP